MSSMPYKEYGREYLDRFGRHDKKDCSTPVGKMAQGEQGSHDAGEQGRRGAFTDDAGKPGP